MEASPSAAFVDVTQSQAPQYGGQRSGLALEDHAVGRAGLGGVIEARSLVRRPLRSALLSVIRPSIAGMAWLLALGIRHCSFCSEEYSVVKIDCLASTAESQPCADCSTGPGRGSIEVSKERLSARPMKCGASANRGIIFVRTANLPRHD